MALSSLLAALCPPVCPAGESGFSSATLGFYSGSFDPPTKAHEAIIRTALEKYPLRRLYVILNVNGPKNFKASIDERMAMLKVASEDLEDKVKILPLDQESKSRTIDGLCSEAKSPALSFLGDDSFLELPPGIRDDPNKFWVVVARTEGPAADIAEGANVSVLKIEETRGISSTKVREELSSGARDSPLLNPKVGLYIREHKLYRALLPDAEKIQRELHAEGFRSFVKDVKVRFPGIDPESLETPPFEPLQSMGARADQFIRWIAEKKGLKGDVLEKFRSSGRELLFSYFRGAPYAKLPGLSPEDLPRSSSGTAAARPEIRAVDLAGYAREAQAYRMDAGEYTADRFPKAIQSLMKNGEAGVFLHDGDYEGAVSFHREQGFTEAYRVHTAEMRPDKKTLLMRDPSTGKWRFVISEIVGGDSLAQIESQLGFAVRGLRISEASHQSPAALAVWNEQGRSLKAGGGELAIIGFKTRIGYKLVSSGNWSETPLTSSGLEISLYTEIKSGRRLLNAKNVYGDQMKELLAGLYEKGFRRFAYLGTAGSLDGAIHAGDVVLPALVRTGTGDWVEFSDGDPELFGKAPGVNIFPAVKHGWVQTLLEETEEKLLSLRAAGVQSIDIEGKYFAEFFRGKTGAAPSMAFIISDEAFGELTYEAVGANFGRVDLTLGLLTGALLLQPEPVLPSH